MSDSGMQEITAPPVGGFVPNLSREEFHDENGRFKPGNTIGKLGGRPRGSRPKLAEAFWRDLHDVWVDHGLQALHTLIETDPGKFVQIVASQMPKDFLLKALNVDELSDADIVDVVLTVRQSIGAEDTEEIRDGTGTASGDQTSGGQSP